jgi:hypothetical protein
MNARLSAADGTGTASLTWRSHAFQQAINDALSMAGQRLGKPRHEVPVCFRFAYSTEADPPRYTRSSRRRRPSSRCSMGFGA